MVIEYQQSLGPVTGEREFHSIGEPVDTRRDQRRFGFGDDRPQLGGRGAGLQRYRHGGQPGQRQIDRGVVDAGEPQDAGPVAGVQDSAGQGSREGLGAIPQLAVGDRREFWLHLHRGTAGLFVGDEPDPALPERRPCRVGRHHSVCDGGGPESRIFGSRGDTWVGPGSAELCIGGVQARDAAFEPGFPGIGLGNIN